MTEQSLTLLGIKLALLEDIEHREYLLSLSPNDPEFDSEEILKSLEECEEQIKQYVLGAVRKVDGIAYHLTEFRRRVGKCWDRGWEEPGAIDREIDRLKTLKEQWLARYEYLEEVTIRALQFIEQTEGRKKVEGEISTLALRKNNPSVEITQIGLIPMEYRRATITLDQETWEQIGKCLSNTKQHMLVRLLAGALLASKSEPKKAEIARVLKSTEPCQNCKGSGKLPGTDWGRCSWCGQAVDSQHKPSCGRQGLVTEVSDHSDQEKCDQCGGSGKVPRGVAGCRLVQNVRLEVK